MKKVVMYTNFLNHHQLPFCLEMEKLTNGDFTFVTQKAIATKRIGTYKIMDSDYTFLLKSYESEDNLNKAYKIGLEADSVIIGSSNDDYIIERLKQRKITFRWSERLFKEKNNFKELIRNLYVILFRHGKYKKYPLYMLASSAYTAADFNGLGVYKNKIYKWGYFPENIKCDVDGLMNNKDGSILYAGRLIDWKHPEVVIEVANRLKQAGYKFKINIIGQGDMKSELISLINKYDLNSEVFILGAMSPEQVREYMKKASIYMVTSDFNEGWGAVVNEAMNSGCSCVCSHAVGSVGFLINHNQNGMIYKYGDINSAYECVKTLLDKGQDCKQMGINAYKTIDELWNAKVAAERFMILSDFLQHGKDTPFKDGPCSKAKYISEARMYKYLINGKSL